MPSSADAAQVAVSSLAAIDPEQAIDVADQFGIGRDNGYLEHLVQIWAEGGYRRSATRWLASQPAGARTDRLRARIQQVRRQASVARAERLKLSSLVLLAWGLTLQLQALVGAQVAQVQLVSLDLVLEHLLRVRQVDLLRVGLIFSSEPLSVTKLLSAVNSTVSPALNSVSPLACTIVQRPQSSRKRRHSIPRRARKGTRSGHAARR